ncbi:MAG: aminoglycoside 3'-phosphotransferase [Defluviitaleaceae bacterium]|nr:aminoglycoside 3'-phosphotransferase [Defluviitaleaceae bacterium]
MTKTPIKIDIHEYPAMFHPLLAGAALYDSSCSELARVVYIARDGGYFLKRAKKGSLVRQAALTEYFHHKGLTSKMLEYVSAEDDWLLTEKVHGEDCTDAAYLAQPERLCDTLATRLAMLHVECFAGCPVQNYTEAYLASAKANKAAGSFDNRRGYASPAEAWATVENSGYILQTDCLLHGDYCLPNIMLDNWRFSGFIDLDSGGVGDRHVDIYWALWSLRHNFKTDKYRQRFIDAYGREKVSEEALQVVAAVEVFG